MSNLKEFKRKVSEAIKSLDDDSINELSKRIHEKEFREVLKMTHVDPTEPEVSKAELDFLIESI